ncbi:Flavonol 3-sulfotransferase, putative [Ricinus communis]|uniref:Sulfotransferase n=1 Tax=Ricinus communis TaxID=3988 RepID=B9RLJ2_RICCO|nr:Flavonol 3-sulfotransferase, putative [Ricinus communis]|eukprot:XP_002514611.3 flavonol sulfotransferase-like [Ricinus communis]
MESSLPNDGCINKYKAIISSFPKEKGWDTRNYMYKYQGFWYYESFAEGVMSAQEHFKAQPNDIIVASCPKTGTTWLKALTFAIVTRGVFDDSTNPLLKKVPHECVPFLELDLAKDSRDRDSAIPLVATHVPYISLPKTILDSGCKIVYVCRDPKDVFVSLWYFVAKQLISKNIEPIPKEDAFELFCKGTAHYGPYWDHVLGYWKASVEYPDKVLFLKYEEMKKDPSFYVKKLAQFMGYPFSLEEEEKGVMQKVTNMCSFENLSNLEVNKSGGHRENTTLAIPNHVYFRNGQAGDWVNHLTPEMGARIDRIFEQKLSGSGLTLTSLPDQDA